MENKRQIRGSRTTTEQLEAYLGFLEENPQFKAGKNTPENPNYLDQKWNELGGKLNSLKGPFKSAKEWKASLTHWKHQLKSRARKIREDAILTGGGEASTTAISGFEERALNLFGIITIQGDNLPSLGFEETIEISNADGANYRADNIEISTPSPLQSSHTESVQTVQMVGQLISAPTPPNQPTTSRIQKRQYSHSNHITSAISECINKLSKVAEDRAKQEEAMLQQRVAIDKQNADSMTRMAEALYVIAKQIEKR